MDNSREARIARLMKAADQMEVSLKGVEPPIDSFAEHGAPDEVSGPVAKTPAKVPRAMLLKETEAPKPQPAQAPEAPAEPAAASQDEEWNADIEHDATGQKAKKIIFGSSKGKKWEADIERNAQGKPKRIVFKRGK